MARLITDLRNEPVRDQPKPTFGRNKLKTKKLRELSVDETARLKERSGDVCECCKRQRAMDKAHVERRWNSSSEPVAEDFIHLCKKCHPIMDKGNKGRTWMRNFQQKVISKSFSQ